MQDVWFHGGRESPDLQPPLDPQHVVHVLVLTHMFSVKVQHLLWLIQMPKGTFCIWNKVHKAFFSISKRCIQSIDLRRGRINKYIFSKYALRSVLQTCSYRTSCWVREKDPPLSSHHPPLMKILLVLWVPHRSDPNLGSNLFICFYRTVLQFAYQYTEFSTWRLQSFSWHMMRLWELLNKIMLIKATSPPCLSHNNTVREWMHETVLLCLYRADTYY